jgi:DNA-binding NarL/FixJ family response regulator
MVPGSVARNKGRRSSAEQVAAERDKARRTREDDWPTGKPKPARLGEQVEVAGGMRAWVREEPVRQKQRQRRGGKRQKQEAVARGSSKRQKKVGSGRVATVTERTRIVALRARGLTYQAIANELGLSYATVRQEFG